MTEAFLDQASSNFSLSFPDTGGVVDEFRRQMRACVKLLTSPYGKLLSTLLGGIQIDGQLAEAFRSRCLEPRHTEAKEALIDALYGSAGADKRSTTFVSTVKRERESPIPTDRGSRRYI